MAEALREQKPSNVVNLMEALRCSAAAARVEPHLRLGKVDTEAEQTLAAIGSP